VSGPTEPSTDEQKRSRGCGQDPGRVTKYIKFHGGVKLPHVYLPARSFHTTALLLAGAAHGATSSWCKFS